MSITDEDVAIEREAAKQRLKNALARQGLAQLRLNEAAQAHETFAKSLRYNPSKAKHVWPDYFLASNALYDYTEAQRSVDKNIADLRTLRVPQAEIDAIRQYFVSATGDE
jgi:hypothetical protein